MSTTVMETSPCKNSIANPELTELKWIKVLQTPFPLGFNDNIHNDGNISKMPDVDKFSLSGMSEM